MRLPSILLLPICLLLFGLLPAVGFGEQLQITYFLEYANYETPVGQSTDDLVTSTETSLQSSGSLDTESYSAEVTYGSLRVSSAASASFFSSGTGSSSGSWTDELTIDGEVPGLPPGGFDPAKVFFTYALSGSASASSSTNASAGASCDIEIVAGSQLFLRQSWAPVSGGDSGEPFSGFTTPGFDITLGLPFSFITRMGGYSLASADSGSGSASVNDAYLVLTGITVTGTWGEAVSGLGMSSDSGVTYSLATIPEPSTFALLGVGVIGLFVSTWRRRRR